VPIPPMNVTKEEFAVVDQIQRAQENEDPEKKRKIKYYLELQDAYLKHIQLGTAVGMWLTVPYFFTKTNLTLSLAVSFARYLC
jgi:hypothetical protein